MDKINLIFFFKINRWENEQMTIMLKWNHLYTLISIGAVEDETNIRRMFPNTEKFPAWQGRRLSPIVRYSLKLWFPRSFCYNKKNKIVIRGFQTFQHQMQNFLLFYYN